MDSDFTANVKPQRFLYAILLVALLVRTGFLYKNWNNLDMDASFLLHAEVARNILHGNWFQIDTTYLRQYMLECRAEKKLIDPQDYPPPTNEVLVPLHNDEGGYGLLLATLWKITGERRWWYVRVLQILLDVLMCWLIYRIGQVNFDYRVGLIAAFLYACFVPSVEMVVRPHRDIWVSYVYITSVFLLTKDNFLLKRVASLAGLGALVGVVALMRSTVVLYVFFLAAIFFLITSRRDALRSALVLCFSFIVILSPLLVRNYVVFDKFMATRGSFWHAFWGGVGQMPNKFGLREEDQSIADFAESLDPSLRPDTERYEDVLKKRAIQFIETEPFTYTSMVVRRAFVMVFPKLGRALFFLPPVDQPTGTLNRSVAAGWLIAIDTSLVCLFLVGLWKSRKQWKKVVLVTAPYVYTVVTLAPFVFQGRNLYNTYFVVLLFASAAIVSFAEDWRLLPKLQSVDRQY